MEGVPGDKNSKGGCDGDEYRKVADRWKTLAGLKKKPRSGRTDQQRETNRQRMETARDAER